MKCFTNRAELDRFYGMSIPAWASIGLAIPALGLQAIGLRVATDGMRAARRGVTLHPTTTAVSDATCLAANCLAFASLAEAIYAWPRERSPMRVSVLCLAVAALLWSLVQF